MNTKLKEMVEYVEWMTGVDHDILSFYEDHDIMISAADLSHNIDYNSEYIGKRLRKLRDVGLLRQEGSTYGLTQTGREFLSGEVAPDEIPHPDDQ